MAGQATERWSDDNMEKSGGSWTATRGFDVVGVTKQIDAFNVRGVPVQGQAHPNTNRLVVTSLSATRLSIDFWRVAVQYAQLDGGGESPEDPEDPLAQPTKITWRFGSTQEPIDRDVDGNPILNSARDPFNPPPQALVRSIFLEARRNEPFFNVKRAVEIQNSVNSSPFKIRGTGIVQAGQAQLVSYAPQGEITRFDTFTPVVYIFELRADGFQKRFMDQGVRAWGYKAGVIAPVKVHIHDANKQPVSADVLLDGRGTPKDPKFKLLHKEGVGHPIKETELTPRSLGAAPPGAEQENTADAVFLKYTIYKDFDFSRLDL